MELCNKIVMKISCIIWHKCNSIIVCLNRLFALWWTLLNQSILWNQELQLMFISTIRMLTMRERRMAEWIQADRKATVTQITTLGCYCTTIEHYIRLHTCQPNTRDRLQSIYLTSAMSLPDWSDSKRSYWVQNEAFWCEEDRVGNSVLDVDSFQMGRKCLCQEGEL